MAALLTGFWRRQEGGHGWCRGLALFKFAGARGEPTKLATLRTTGAALRVGARSGAAGLGNH